MQLTAWMEREGITPAEFGERIGRTAAAVRFYRRGLRMPRPEVMAAIQRETGGEVGPPDFYAAVNGEAA